MLHCECSSIQSGFCHKLIPTVLVRTFSTDGAALEPSAHRVNKSICGEGQFNSPPRSLWGRTFDSLTRFHYQPRRGWGSNEEELIKSRNSQIEAPQSLGIRYVPTGNLCTCPQGYPTNYRGALSATKGNQEMIQFQQFNQGRGVPPLHAIQ